MKRVNTLIAITLAFVMVFNINTFRRDTYANPLVVAGWEITAAVVSAIAAALVAGGVQISTQEDAEYFTQNLFVHIMSEEEIEEKRRQRIEGMGFTYDAENMVIDVKDTDRVSVKYDPATGTFTDLSYNTVAETGKIAVDGFMTVAGIVKTIDQVTSIGEELYDYLHAGDFTFNKGMSYGSGSFFEIRQAYGDFISEQTMNILGYSYESQLSSGSIDYYTFPQRYRFENYSFYSYTKPPGVGNYLVDKTVCFFACLCWNADGSYCIYGNAVYYDDGGSITCFQSSQRKSGYDYNENMTSILNTPLNFGFSANRLYYSLMDLSLSGSYINTDLISDTGVLDTPATDTITDGEREYPLDKTKTGETIWDVPTAIPDVINTNGAVDKDGKTILPLPGITDGVLDFPVDVPINPDIDLNPTLPDTVLESDNIFDLLANFFRNFWKLLSQNLLEILKAFLELLQGFFVACFVPPAGYIEGKINGLRLQFCPALAPIEIASKEIPDITWSIGDSSLGSAVHMSDVVIVDNSFLRNNIVTIRSIICGFVWFLFVINKLFALLRYLNVVQVPEGLKGGSDK